MQVVMHFSTLKETDTNLYLHNLLSDILLIHESILVGMNRTDKAGFFMGDVGIPKRLSS